MHRDDQRDQLFQTSSTVTTQSWSRKAEPKLGRIIGGRTRQIRGIKQHVTVRGGGGPDSPQAMQNAHYVSMDSGGTKLA